MYRSIRSIRSIRPIRPVCFLYPSGQHPTMEVVSPLSRIGPRICRFTSLDDSRTRERPRASKDLDYFFLTTPFVPASGSTPRREFLALYLFLFENDGELIEVRITDTDLGSRRGLKTARVQALKDELLATR